MVPASLQTLLDGRGFLPSPRFSPQIDLKLGFSEAACAFLRLVHAVPLALLVDARSCYELSMRPAETAP